MSGRSLCPRSAFTTMTTSIRPSATFSPLTGGAAIPARSTFDARLCQCRRMKATQGLAAALQFSSWCGTCPVRLNTTAPAEITRALCTACAMCCNGVLFSDVRLQEGDDRRRLAELGVPLSAPSNPRFRQPCSCLREGVCQIYLDRPNRCRTFECRLLQKTLAGEITKVTALRTIGAAKKRVEGVRRILRELGDTDESVPLSRRYQRMMRQPIDLAADERLARLRGQLMKTVAELASVLERHFVG